MRKFGIKLVLFACIEGLLVLICLYCSAYEPFKTTLARITDSEIYGGVNNGTREIIPYIEKVQAKSDYTKLIVGDSVCGQVYNRFQEYNDQYCVCGTNQALTIAGQYLLINSFLNSHENVTDVYLIVISDSLKSDFNVQLSYQYMVIPFTQREELGYLREETQVQIKKKYGSFFCKPTILNLIDQSPLNRKIYLNFLDFKDMICQENEENQGIISNISYIYLEEIIKLCEQKNVNFYLIPGPHADRKEQHEQVEKMKKEIIGTAYEDIIGEYLSEIKYYSVDLFRDSVHFDEDKVDERFFGEIAGKSLPRDFHIMNDLED